MTEEKDKNELEESIEVTAQENVAELEVNDTEATDVEKRLQEARAEIERLNDQLLRKIAEFENYRKRTLAEKTELLLNGGKNVMASILPIIDDFERALKNMNQSEDDDAQKQGVELIYKKLVSTLEKQGLKQLNPIGDDFNTDFHEAIAMIPTDNPDQKGKVIDCTQVGYTLNDKVLRYAQVAVGQ